MSAASFDFRAEVVAFYTAHNPTKLSDVDSLCDQVPAFVLVTNRSKIGSSDGLLHAPPRFSITISSSPRHHRVAMAGMACRGCVRRGLTSDGDITVMCHALRGHMGTNHKWRGKEREMLALLYKKCVGRSPSNVALADIVAVIGAFACCTRLAINLAIVTIIGVTAW